MQVWCCWQAKLCDPHLSALELRFSRRCAIQIDVYLYYYYSQSTTASTSLLVDKERWSQANDKVQRVLSTNCELVVSVDVDDSVVKRWWSSTSHDRPTWDWSTPVSACPVDRPWLPWWSVDWRPSAAAAPASPQVDSTTTHTTGMKSRSIQFWFTKYSDCSTQEYIVFLAKYWLWDNVICKLLWSFIIFSQCLLLNLIIIFLLLYSHSWWIKLFVFIIFVYLFIYLLTELYIYFNK